MKLFQITQVPEGWYVLEFTFYCLFKLQCFTKPGKIEENKKKKKKNSKAVAPSQASRPSRAPGRGSSPSRATREQGRRPSLRPSASGPLGTACSFSIVAPSPRANSGLPDSNRAK